MLISIHFSLLSSIHLQIIETRGTDPHQPLQNSMIIKLFFFQLRNVIVKSSSVATKLLQNGKLENRTNFIPLDKIQARCISANELKVAQKLVGKDNVFRYSHTYSNCFCCCIIPVNILFPSF